LLPFVTGKPKILLPSNKGKLRVDEMILEAWKEEARPVRIAPMSESRFISSKLGNASHCVQPQQRTTYPRYKASIQAAAYLPPIWSCSWRIERWWDHGKVATVG
jgi:hypothetical protein